MKLTNTLLACILVILLKQFYPAELEMLTVIAVVALAVYCCYWLTKLPAKWRKHRAQTKQEEADEKEFWESQKELDAIRARFDPKHEWNEATTLPSEYRNEVRKVNSRHREMLYRRNGYTAKDLELD